jgi:hypothetical protein
MAVGVGRREAIITTATSSSSSGDGGPVALVM